MSRARINLTRGCAYAIAASLVLLAACGDAPTTPQPSAAAVQQTPAGVAPPTTVTPSGGTEDPRGRTPTPEVDPSATPSSSAPPSLTSPPSTDSPPGPDPVRLQHTPAILQLGVASGLGDAARVAERRIATWRYQYLSGGVGTGDGWTTWSGGQFAGHYIEESVAAGLVPVFTYYMLLQSAPGSGSESTRIQQALSHSETMTQYFEELGRFFRQAAPSRTQVILHVEPDLWGFAQQAGDNDPRNISVALDGAEALLDVGLPQDLTGFAEAILLLRDRLAPNVQVAYHMSIWGSGEDPILSNASDRTIDRLAERAVSFYQELGVQFDLTFAEMSDRDSGFKQAQWGMGDEAWWTADDFARHARLLSRYADGTGQAMVLWQIPFGNTRMRAQDNSWNHYQDNKVEWLLDDPDGPHLAAYVEAGVIALLFGRGADGATDASDANGDGITNPSPINGNDRLSTNEDDDGGYFREQAARYYEAGGVRVR